MYAFRSSFSEGAIFWCVRAGSLLLVAAGSHAQDYGVHSAAAAAKVKRETVVDVTPPIIDYVQFSNAKEILARTKPVVATVVGSVGIIGALHSVGGHTPLLVETEYFIAIHSDTPDAATIPRVGLNAIPSTMRTTVTNGGPYTAIRVRGGSASVDGITYRQPPFSHPLVIGRTYLFFVFFNQGDVPGALLFDDSTAVLAQDEKAGRFVPLVPSKFPDLLSPFIGCTPTTLGSIAKRIVDGTEGSTR